jgi:hypothetical protein
MLTDAFLKVSNEFDQVQLIEKGDPKSAAEAILRAAFELRRASEEEDPTVLIVIDQLEELLDPELFDLREKFLKCLSNVWKRAKAKPSPKRIAQVLVLATLRSEFIGELADEKSVKDLGFKNILVHYLTRSGIERAVVGPAKAAGIELESGLLQDIINDSQGKNSLPLVALTLNKLWEEDRASGKLTCKTYQGLGGVKGVLRNEIEKIIPEKLSKFDQERTLRAAFHDLVRMDETGNFLSKPALWRQLPEQAHSILQTFVEAGILVSDDYKGEKVVEIAHESIFNAWPKLSKWLKEDSPILTLRRDLQRDCEEWLKQNKQDEYLSRWRGMRLRRALELAVRQPFSAIMQEFLRAAREAEIHRFDEKEKYLGLKLKGLKEEETYIEFDDELIREDREFNYRRIRKERYELSAEKIKLEEEKAMLSTIKFEHVK